MKGSRRLLLDEAHDIGDSTASASSSDAARTQCGRAIVEEAERRNAEIVVMGAPRLPHRTGRSEIFGKTVDYVLRHAPCRVMVPAAPRTG
jgi:hypothetical protein